MTTTWQTITTITLPHPHTDDQLLDLFDKLGQHGASISPNEDNSILQIALAVDSDTATAAIDETIRILHNDGGLSDFTITSLTVRTWEETVKTVNDPMFPKVVGYAEIAKLAGVTRQRAYQFPQIDTFPKPVIETAQGPLFTETAILAWLETRDAKPGRPRKTAKKD